MNTQQVAAAKRTQERLLIEQQRESLDAWVDYLTDPNTNYPDALKYWVMCSVIKMGNYNDDQETFNDRSRGSTAPFPELDAEALAYVIDSIRSHLAGKTGADTDVVKSKLLTGGNFSKLYAFATRRLSESKKEGLLNITDGEWKVYPKNSEPDSLVSTLAGFHTRWCIAQHATAKQYLASGDIHIFYSHDGAGNPTIPRVAIAMTGRQVREVRGIANGQNLDKHIGDVVATKLKKLPDGEKYNKRVTNMLRMTAIEKKQGSRETLSQDDLKFLYEIDSPIEGFGMSNDPRIAEILRERDIFADFGVILDTDLSAPNIDVECLRKVYGIGNRCLNTRLRDMLLMRRNFAHDLGICQTQFHSLNENLQQRCASLMAQDALKNLGLSSFFEMTTKMQLAYFLRADCTLDHLKNFGVADRTQFDNRLKIAFIQRPAFDIDDPGKMGISVKDLNYDEQKALTERQDFTLDKIAKLGIPFTDLSDSMQYWFITRKDFVPEDLAFVGVKLNELELNNQITFVSRNTFKPEDIVACGTTLDKLPEFAQEKFVKRKDFAFTDFKRAGLSRFEDLDSLAYGAFVERSTFTLADIPLFGYDKFTDLPDDLQRALIMRKGFTPTDLTNLGVTLADINVHYANVVVDKLTSVSDLRQTGIKKLTVLQEELQLRILNNNLKFALAELVEFIGTFTDLSTMTQLNFITRPQFQPEFLQSLGIENLSMLHNVVQEEFVNLDRFEPRWLSMFHTRFIDMCGPAQVAIIKRRDIGKILPTLMENSTFVQLDLAAQLAYMKLPIELQGILKISGDDSRRLNRLKYITNPGM
jgi:hypothetical protein